MSAVTHNPGQFVGPVDLPKEHHGHPLDPQFERPIYVVDIHKGVIGGTGMDQHWEDERTRGKIKPPPPKPVLTPPEKKAAPQRKKRKYGEWSPEEVIKAYKDSGQNKGKAARIMQVPEQTYREWLKKVMPEAFDGRRKHK